MKKYFLFTGIVILLFLILINNIEPNPVGTYVAKNNKFSIDTIILNKKGFYDRVIYNKKDKKLLFKNKDRWTYKEGRIDLYGFFPNDDEPLYEGYDFESALMVYSFPLERSFGRVVFHYNEVSARYQFHKLFFSK
ncbi:MAG: hypothetical protein ABFS35_05820 [Bacteroidota bacterium]